MRFNQALENYLKVSVGNDTYDLTKYNKIQITDTSVIRVGNIGSVVLPYWICICNNKNNKRKITKFIRTTRTKSPTTNTGVTTLPPIGSAFMYIETSGDNHGQNRVFVSWERTDIIQITKLTLYYERFSILTNDSLKKLWVILEYRFFLKMILGQLDVIYLKIIDIVIHQLNGHWQI